MPERIQRRRTRGWRMPPGAVCVDRGTPYGNPFLARKHGQGGAVAMYRAWLLAQPALAEIRHELRGRDLACWCPLTDEAWYPVPCHADVLLEVANA